MLVDREIVLVDNNTEALLHRIGLEALPRVVIESGEENKSILTVSSVWEQMMELGMTRHSRLINVGGGMLLDLGGFAASTYKRGICFVNVPTTLLAMVDASVGGKNGVNFGGIKNGVGVFREADEVRVYPELLETLDIKEILSGYAEMLKHGFVGGMDLLDRTYSYDIERLDINDLKILINENIDLKRSIVSEDFCEKGRRKVLNFGHTAGHAFEELGVEKGLGLRHGYCVAWGMVVATYISVVKCGLERCELTRLRSFVREMWGELPFDCSHYARLYEIMCGDKKNWGGRVNFTLLRKIGDMVTDVDVEKELIFEAIDFLR